MSVPLDGLREWAMRRYVSAPARERATIDLDRYFIEELCSEVRKKGWEPVEGTRTEWHWIDERALPYEDPDNLRPVWRVRATVFAVPARDEEQ